MSEIITREQILKNEKYNDMVNSKFCSKLHQKLKANGTGRFAASPGMESVYAARDILGDDCKVYLEVGVLHGGSILMMMNHHKPAKFVGIDQFNFYGKKKDPHAGNVTVSLDNTKSNIEKFRKHEYEFELIQGNSQDDNILNVVREKYPVLDLVYIDGDHSYEGALKDFENYAQFCRKGSVVAFDNYGESIYPGIPPAVREASCRKEFEEIGQFGYVYLMQKI